MHTPNGRGESDELDSQDKCARRRRLRRENRRDLNFAPCGGFIGSNKRLRNRQRSRTGKVWGHHGRRQWGSVGAAVILCGLVGIGCGSAATVRAFVRAMQANPRRSKQRTHQYNGHRRALEDASQHGLSLLRQPVLAVIWITALHHSGRI